VGGVVSGAPSAVCSALRPVNRSGVKTAPCLLLLSSNRAGARRLPQPLVEGHERVSGGATFGEDEVIGEVRSSLSELAERARECVLVLEDVGPIAPQVFQHAQDRRPVRPYALSSTHTVSA
jgi:hypothetical protein